MAPAFSYRQVCYAVTQVEGMFKFLLGLPHMTTKDDEYIGYRIPAGSIVVGNIWYVFANLTIPRSR